MDQRPLPWIRVFPGTPELSCALAQRQQQLEDALRQVGELQRREVSLKKKLARLTSAVAQARQYADHDELTCLPNRRLLLDRFNQAVARAVRQHQQMALLFVDLDRFKSINDTLGHAAGDGLLQQVAARLLTCIRGSDTACRYGGDEFVVLLPEVGDENSALAATSKIRDCLAQPFRLDDRALWITTSIGMSMYPGDGTTYGELISQADIAMYYDKMIRSGRAACAPEHTAKTAYSLQEPP